MTQKRVQPARNPFAPAGTHGLFCVVAWRIHDSVIRGEIDNRVKGIVRGKLWLDGLAGPVTLELDGNACPDLAGCLLKFKNPARTLSDAPEAGVQSAPTRQIGNLSASQKVRIFTSRDEEAFEMIDHGEKPPERMANALYLEWFSEGNGGWSSRARISNCTISAPEWRLTPPRNNSVRERRRSRLGNVHPAIE